MLQAPQRTGLSGPTLIRLLTRLTEVDAPESRQPLSDHLSQWLGWTDAIALSAALNNRPPAIAPGARQFSSAEERECERVRTTLADAIASDTAATAAKRQMPGQVSAKVAALQADDADYSNFRQRYLSLQHTMETSIGNLRSRLRGMLAAKTPEMTRLAVVDAIMDRALLPRERTLLGAIPKLLQGHFDRLRLAEQAALEAAAQAQAETAVPAGTADEPAADVQAPAAPGGQRNGRRSRRRACAGGGLRGAATRFIRAHAGRVAGDVPQGYAQRAAGRIGCSFTTGGRAACHPSRQLTGTLCPSI